MTFVVTENCRRCRFTDCVAVCPVEAIYDESQLPDELREWVTVNAEKAKKLPVINETGEAFAGAEERKKQLGF